MLPFFEDTLNAITENYNGRAIREVLGDSVYDEIGEMNRGEVKDRKVRLHYSPGTKYQKQGHDVLEMGFAGSGGQEMIRAHKGRRRLSDGRSMIRRTGHGTGNSSAPRQLF
ncbi:MAG: hypothetical protein J6Y95_01210 [Lachnospiraceae bacterium]|nr:hypothetical protein [Lachnospiraceae bacterium]